MKEESLKKIKNELIEIIEESDIDNLDKIELMINICHFLDKDKYEKNIKVLKLYQDKN